MFTQPAGIKLLRSHTHTYTHTHLVERDVLAAGETQSEPTISSTPRQVAVVPLLVARKIN